MLSFLTIHQSKGLEFPFVILTDLTTSSPTQKDIWIRNSDGKLGYRFQHEGEWQESEIYTQTWNEKTESENDEYWRILYVALTRTQKSCHVVVPNPVPTRLKHLEKFC